MMKGRRPRVGLALGGGGARGAAHVGVIRVLEQEGIPIDLVAGSSVGALVGGSYAAGMPLAEIEAIFSYVKFRDLVRWAWPRGGLFDSAPLARSFERVVGSHRVEELPLPFAATATDVQTGEGIALREGPLAEVVRASTAMPFFVQPVPHGGRLLADGGVLHKVPVTLAREMGADIVIAVDLGCPSFAAGPARNPFSALMQTLDMMDRKLVAYELQGADVVVKPEVVASTFNFRGYRSLVQVGERVAAAAVGRIRSLLDRVTGPAMVPPAGAGEVAAGIRPWAVE